MEKTFLKIVEQVNKANGQANIDNIIEQWEITDEETDEMVENLVEFMDKIDLNILPYVLESLYKSNDKFKFFMFCQILMQKQDELPFITPLENIPLFEAKYEMLLPTLIEVSKAYNGIADCMYLILLNSDPFGNFLDEELRNELLESINEKFESLIDYIKNNEEVDDSAYSTLELLLDISTHINNEKSFELIEKIGKLKLNVDSLLFLIKFQAINNIEIDQSMVKWIVEDDYNAYRLLEILERIRKTEILPEGILTQEKIAMANMIHWLIYSTELGKEPEHIELVDTLEKENTVFYIYKFKAQDGKFKERNYMLGISGGYEKGVVTTQTTGYTFSNFEEIQDDYKKQAECIIELIASHWKKRAEN